MKFIDVAHAGVISDAPDLTDIGLNVLSFLLSVLGVITLVMIVISGMIYFFAGGDGKKMEAAKKSSKTWALGLVAAMGSYVAIKFFSVLFK